jgi:predicted PurR-regulated permease PerM
MAKTNRRKVNVRSHATKGQTRAKAPRTFIDRIKHWLEKKAQGLPMTTIVIIIIVLIVLAVVVIFFFGQFSTGQTAVNQQVQIGGNATNTSVTKWQDFVKIF